MVGSGAEPGRSPQAIGLTALLGGSERDSRRVGPGLESMYRFVLWLVPAVEKFLRRQKFLLFYLLGGVQERHGFSLNCA